MAIPKEPRALMINIMYLVLTAMLALNVSAEIFNAFKIVDKGLKKSNHALEEANNALPQAIRDGAKKKASLAKYADAITPGRELSKMMREEIDDIILHLVDQSGNKDGKYDDGDYIMKEGKRYNLKGKKNKDVTTRYLVNGGKGEELKAKLVQFRQNMIDLVDEEDRGSFASGIPDIVDDKTWKDKAPKSKNAKYDWATFNFKQMPVQSVLPILRKFQNDVISTESAFLKYLAGKVGGKDLVFDKFAVVSSPEKTYVINGEQFKTEVFLSASASKESNTGISLSVNGKTVPQNSDGVAVYTETARGVGKKSYTVKGTIKDPITGEVKPFSKTYEYEVGERSAAISAAKMNVFYIGVPNPVEVSVAGVPSNKVKVNMTGGGGNISRNSDGTFTVNVTQPTNDAKITVSADGFSATKAFRVKRIPDPVAKLGKSKGGKMGSGNFKAQLGIIPDLPGFDFDAKCKISGFNVVRLPRGADPEIAPNPGGRFAGDGLRIVNKAKAGDRFFFENIKCKCPGDKAPRDLGTLGFTLN